MNTARSRLGLAAGLAALVVCSATVGAGAAGLIGSRDIADNSIRGVDIKNGTVSGKDVKDGALSRSDFRAGTLPGAGSIATWSGTFTADGSQGETTPVAVSNQTVPSNSHLRGMSISVTGDDSPCTSNFLVWVAPLSLASGGQDSIATKSIHKRDTTVVEYSYGELSSTAEAAEPMAILAACANDSGDIAVPSFDFTVKFSITQQPEPSATAFN